MMALTNFELATQVDDKNLLKARGGVCLIAKLVSIRLVIRARVKHYVVSAEKTLKIKFPGTCVFWLWKTSTGVCFTTEKK